MFANKRILVTGGCGFIGSHVVDALRDQNQVVVVDNLSSGTQFTFDNVEYHFTSVQDTITSGELLSQFRPHLVFHLAALPRIQPSFDSPIEHDEANVRPVMSLMRGLQDLGSASNLEAVVISSSSSCYGDPTQIPTSEQSAIDPLSPYALQKYASEMYGLILGSRWNIPVTSLRYFNVYGPRSFNPSSRFNAYSSVVGIFLDQFKKAIPLTITGDGSQERDFIHVADVVAANFVAAANIEVTRNRYFNVGLGVPVSIRKLAEAFDSDLVYIEARQGESRITCADNSALKALGWRPTINVFDFIASEVERYA